MDIVPPIRVTRFEQLEPGDLFFLVDERMRFFALKTQKPANEDKNLMVLLGPTFSDDIDGPWLAPWQAATVLSFGKKFSILPSLSSASWQVDEQDRGQVCLAVAGDNAYIRTNGSQRPNVYFECFVDAKTGEVFERRPPGIIAFTRTWEIAILSPNRPPQTILKFPLS